MRCNYIREKKYQCGDDYMAVGVFSIIPQEHRGRGKKRKESSEGQKAKNKMDSLAQAPEKGADKFQSGGNVPDRYIRGSISAGGHSGLPERRGELQAAGDGGHLQAVRGQGGRTSA